MSKSQSQPPSGLTALPCWLEPHPEMPHSLHSIAASSGGLQSDRPPPNFEGGYQVLWPKSSDAVEPPMLPVPT